MEMKKRSSRIVLLGILISVIIGCATAGMIGGPVPGGLKDGIYDGAATNGPVKVKAKVTIQNQRIAHISLMEHRNWRGKPANDTIPERIIGAQSTRVDAVSGATASSHAIMNAVEDAVQKAK